MTFKGERPTTCGESSKAEGRDLRDPKGPARMAQEVAGPMFGTWMMGQEWGREVREELGGGGNAKMAELTWF